MTPFAEMRSERRAGILFCGLMLLAGIVALAGLVALRMLDTSSQRAIMLEAPAFAVARRVESRVLAAQLALHRAHAAGSQPDRRAHFADYASEVAAALATLRNLSGLVSEGTLAHSLSVDFERSQRIWSASARAYMAALESGAPQPRVRELWDDVESAFFFVRMRAVRVAVEGLQPAVFSQAAELHGTVVRGYAMIGGTLLIGVLIALVGIAAAVRLIRSQRLEQERENDYRDFDRRVQRAFQLVEAEADVLGLVCEVLDHAVSGSHSAELMLSDASRTKMKRITNTSAPSDLPGCPVPMLADCPTVQSNSRMIYSSNKSFEACPWFRKRRGGACSAACVPVSVMGRTVGVVHVVGPEGELPDGDEMRRFESIARKAGDRIGLARALMSKDEAANTDMLTGLANRRALELALPNLTAEHEVFAVVYCDLDHFKKLNDEHGHDMGDRALRLFAQVLRNSLRPSDLICRWGGEEFVIVMPGSTAALTRNALERVASRLRDLVKVSPVPAFTSSFGVSDSTMAESFEDILHRADTALMSAKHAGRDCIVIDAAAGTDALDAQTVVTVLEDASGDTSPAATSGRVAAERSA